MAKKRLMLQSNALANQLKWESTKGNLNSKLIIYLIKKVVYLLIQDHQLYIGIESLDFLTSGEVITPALTFSTTIGCLAKNNLIPVFVDVDPLTYCIDTSQIEEMITEKTVAILAPNLMGNLCNWPKIREIANQYNLLVIEDSADT